VALSAMMAAMAIRPSGAFLSQAEFIGSLIGNSVNVRAPSEAAALKTKWK
jgi:hypothetical protein